MALPGKTEALAPLLATNTHKSRNFFCLNTERYILQIHLITRFTLINEVALINRIWPFFFFFISVAMRQRGKRLDYVTRVWNEVDEVESIISY